MYKLKTNRGFTLIELLVVIAIIGMLASVILASLSTARMKARDVRRLMDAKQIQTALEMYYSDHNKYPIPTNSFVDNLTMLTPTYIQTLPKDPLYKTGDHRYRYWYSDPYNGYTIMIWWEKYNNWCKIPMGTGYSGWATYTDCR